MSLPEIDLPTLMEVCVNDGFTIKTYFSAKEVRVWAQKLADEMYSNRSKRGGFPPWAWKIYNELLRVSVGEE